MPDERILAALAGLSEQIAANNERLARIEAKLEAQTENVRVFWATHWPPLVARLEHLESRAQEHSAEIADLRVEVAKIPRQSRRKAGAIAAAGGGGIVAIVELVRAWLRGHQ